MDWYNSFPDLTEAEIWATVTNDDERKENDTIESHYVKMIATIRAYSELIIEDQKTKEERIAAFDRTTDNALDAFLQFSKWQTIYKSIR